MILALLTTFACMCVGMSAAWLIGYPLYYGLLAGWLCPSVVIIAVLLPRVMMRRRTEAHSWRTTRSSSRSLRPVAYGPKRDHKSLSACG